MNSRFVSVHKFVALSLVWRNHGKMTAVDIKIAT